MLRSTLNQDKEFTVNYTKKIAKNPLCDALRETLLDNGERVAFRYDSHTSASIYLDFRRFPDFIEYLDAGEVHIWGGTMEEVKQKLTAELSEVEYILDSIIENINSYDFSIPKDLSLSAGEQFAISEMTKLFNRSFHKCVECVTTPYSGVTPYLGTGFFTFNNRYRLTDDPAMTLLISRVDGTRPYTFIGGSLELFSFRSLKELFVFYKTEFNQSHSQA